MPCGFLGNSACPRAYGAKRVRVRIREKEGFTHPWLWRAPCFWGAKNVETARWVNLRALVLKAFSLLRFFVALDKEMTCRHAQWLTVIKKLANSCRPLTPKAATPHQPRPLTLKPVNPGPSFHGRLDNTFQLIDLELSIQRTPRNTKRTCRLCKIAMGAMHRA